MHSGGSRGSVFGGSRRALGRPLRIGLVACLAVVLAACTTIPFASVPKGAPIDVRLLPLHAEPDPTAGGRIVDAAGREVLLRGVNVNALVEYWQYGAFPTTFPLTTADAQRLAAVGWNSVRLLVSWSRVEPQPGPVRRGVPRPGAVMRCGCSRATASSRSSTSTRTRGVRRSRLVPARSVRPDRIPRSAGTARPVGQRSTAEHRVATSPACAELSPAVRAAFIAFWTNQPGPGGVGIRTRYADMVGHVAARFAARARGRRLRPHERAERIRSAGAPGLVGPLRGIGHGGARR